MSTDPFHLKELKHAGDRYTVTTERGTWEFPLQFVQNAALYHSHILDAIHGVKRVKMPSPKDWATMLTEHSYDWPDLGD
jgi:hypothetical protein